MGDKLGMRSVQSKGWILAKSNRPSGAAFQFGEVRRVCHSG